MRLRKPRGRSLWRDGSEEIDHLVGVNRSREVEALQFRATQLGHRVCLELGLDALGDDIHAERASDRHHRLDDGPGNIDARNSADERAVDFDLVELKIAEIAQARIARAEVVERSSEAERPEVIEDQMGMIGRLKQDALGYLKDEAARIDIVFRNKLVQGFGEIDVAELHRERFTEISG